MHITRISRILFLNISRYISRIANSNLPYIFIFIFLFASIHFNFPFSTFSGLQIHLHDSLRLRIEITEKKRKLRTAFKIGLPKSEMSCMITKKYSVNSYLSSISESLSNYERSTLVNAYTKLQRDLQLLKIAMKLIVFVVSN